MLNTSIDWNAKYYLIASFCLFVKMFCFVFLSMRKNLLFFSASPNGGFKCDAPTEYRVALIDYYKEGVKDSPIKMKNFRAKCCKTTKQLSLHHLVVTSNIACYWASLSNVCIAQFHLWCWNRRIHRQMINWSTKIVGY